MYPNWVLLKKTTNLRNLLLKTGLKLKRIRTIRTFGRITGTMMISKMISQSNCAPNYKRLALHKHTSHISSQNSHTIHSHHHKNAQNVDITYQLPLTISI
ncbi:hypothetical protein K492DRAFT_206113 [Lichtheimia hyalospora FSU 10163]|nr:hypothetical protein K492DRAFT_206113 [Lichtheimia hyalospora FSU 10163]